MIQGNTGDIGTNPKQKKKLGGVKSTLFIYGTLYFIFITLYNNNFVYFFLQIWILCFEFAVASGLENVAFTGNAVSIFTYFFGYMNFSLTKSATMLTNYMGTSYVLSLFGGYVCDTYLSRYRSSILFGSIQVLVCRLHF